MVTTTLLIDGMLSGTGIRNAVEGGYIAPRQLNLSADLCAALAEWVSRYAQAHFGGYCDEAGISSLDQEGLALRDRLADERLDHKVGYYSDALMKRLDDLPHT
jgi:hypothetical protein